MPRLDNPPSNPCFGCGPANPRGLGLTMHRAEHEGRQVVSTEHTPGEEEIGWPGFLHGGLHFLLLYEVSYWAALELGGRLMTAGASMRFDQPVTPRTGRPVVVRGWIEEAPEGAGEGMAAAEEGLAAAEEGSAAAGEEGVYTIVAESRGGDRLLGRLASTWSPVSRERLEDAGIELPGYLWDEVRAR